MINRTLILGTSIFASLASSGAHAALASWPMVCEPDQMTRKFLDSDLAALTWLVSIDTLSNPLKVRIEPSSKRLPLIDLPISEQFLGPNHTWISSGTLRDPSLGTALGEPIVYSFTVVLGERPGAVEVERGEVRYRLGQTDLLAKFNFECHRQGSAWP